MGGDKERHRKRRKIHKEEMISLIHSLTHLSPPPPPPVPLVVVEDENKAIDERAKARAIQHRNAYDGGSKTNQSLKRRERQKQQDHEGREEKKSVGLDRLPFREDENEKHNNEQ